MANKSTNIGGAGGKRPGAGRKSKPLSEKLADGNPGNRELRVLNLPENPNAEPPKPHDFVDDPQAMGKPLQAREIFDETWQWLKDIGCTRLINPMLVERFAMSSARWIQLEQLVSERGLLSQHPTTRAECRSPLVAEAVLYQNQANRLWDEIWQIIRENCATAYTGRTPQDDVMDRLLRARGGGDG